MISGSDCNCAKSNDNDIGENLDFFNTSNIPMILFYNNEHIPSILFEALRNLQKNGPGQFLPVH